MENEHETLCYQAKTIKGRLVREKDKKGKLRSMVEDGPGPVIEVDGESYGPKREVYLGEPSDDLLADVRVMVHTMRGKPFPGSAADKHTPRTPEDVELRSDGRPRMGPGSMAEMQRLGFWPDAKEVEVQKFRAGKLASPGAMARALGERQGMREREIKVLVAKAEGSFTAIPDPDLLLAEAEVNRADDAEERSAKPKSPSRKPRARKPVETVTA